MKKINKYRLVRVKECSGQYFNAICVSSNDINAVYQSLSKKLTRIANTGKCGDICGCAYSLGDKRKKCKSQYQIREMW